MRQLKKKGVVENMLLLVAKLMFAAITILIIVFASYKLGSVFFTKEKTLAETDFERIISEIPEMQKSETMNVPVYAYDYKILLIDKENPALPLKCKGKACACFYIGDSEDPKRCEEFKDFLSSQDPNKCGETNKCIKNSEAAVIKGQNIVTLVSNNYIIEIKS